MARLLKILSGEETIRLYLDFLARNNHTDLLVLKTTKDALDGRSSIYHNALTLQNAFMHSGTASDVFLRNNLDWLGRASNWGKFSVTASLGVINKGNTWDAMRLLGPYLPTQGGEGSSGPYSEGGALYALGLINAGRGKDVVGYLRDKLKEATSEIVQHGAALGLGVAGMASGNAGSSHHNFLSRYICLQFYQMRMRTFGRLCSPTLRSPVRRVDTPWVC